jgi:hypothetical protein
MEHVYHRRYADYFTATAGEVIEGDGVRLVPIPARGVPIDLAIPLVVIAASNLDGLVSLTLIDRSSMVDSALGYLPEGVAMENTTMVFDATDPILIRG